MRRRSTPPSPCRRDARRAGRAAQTWYETSPIGGPGFQEPFLNGAAVLETTLEPETLLTELQRIENEHGRGP